MLTDVVADIGLSECLCMADDTARQEFRQNLSPPVIRDNLLTPVHSRKAHGNLGEQKCAPLALGSCCRCARVVLPLPLLFSPSSLNVPLSPGDDFQA
ncbi:hypothetical protein BDR05DRAFT_963105 [Suillus weaverae]|nr:hypothetical protein BDR05DRAFT_963105 [Suillus weaverae]